MKVGIAGFGTIGREIAKALRDGVPGLELGPVAVRDTANVRGEYCATFVTSFDELATGSDIVVECAPAAILSEIAVPTLRKGGTLLVLSAAGLLERPDILDLAAATGGRIIVPSGSVGGLDALCAARRGTLKSVRLVTRKPPASLRGAPGFQKWGIDLDRDGTSVCVFRGSAREAARAFPANVNVAAAIALAGLGPDRTEVEVWADHAATTNRHMIEVESDVARFSLTIDGVQSTNPRTSRLAAKSAIATLERLVSPVVIGT